MRKILYIFMFCLLVTYICLPSEQTAVYSVNVSALNLRVCPKTNCQIVAKLIAGETVTILEDGNRWVKVKTDKGRGYVAKAYLTLQKQSDSSKNHSSTWGWLLAILMLFFIVYKENPKATDKQTEKSKPNNKKSTLYDVLNVTAKASLAEIKKSYRALAKRYHPDLNPDKKLAETKFIELNEAYKILTDKQKRADYDAKLNAAETEKAYTEEKILLRARSIQDLRAMIVKCLDISPNVIKFANDGTVFINRQYAFCWRPIKIENARYHPRMKIHWEFYTELYFEYYRPINPCYNSQYDEWLEKILLTAPDIENLSAFIEQIFIQNDVFLADDGTVYIDGTALGKWRYNNSGYFEYYVTSDNEFYISL